MQAKSGIAQNRLGGYIIDMIQARKSAAGRGLFCVSAAAFYLIFTAAAALPGVVLCHRPGGQVAVEISGPAGVCLCQECDHCRERLANDALGHSHREPALEACHCTHQPILSKTGTEALLRDEGDLFLSADRAGLTSPFLPIVPDSGRPARETLFVKFSPLILPYPVGTLRC
jgi:hypothetical protein